MAYGYCGEILHVDLTGETAVFEQPEENFYRKYLGGAGIGTYYALKAIPAGCDPLGPDNALIFSAGLLTGTPAPAVPRFTISGKSPLTGTIGKSEAGGYWGPGLKRAGFDAVIIKGIAETPVYLLITVEGCFFKDASEIWGKDTLETHLYLKEKEGKAARIAQIGPGGENRVAYANIVNELAHFNGRNGFGAVMGAKNLKAVVVRGNRKVDCYDGQTAKELTRWVSDNLKDHPQAYGLYKDGTPAGLTVQNAGGTLPTNNWQENVFNEAEAIGAGSMERILLNRKGCFSCPIKCKRVVQVEAGDMSVDPRLGGPEYETLACLGSNLGIGDLELIAKANELCNRYTIDTISFGMTLSFAMECFEKGLITIEDTGGYELEFGNKDILLPLIKQTAYREGFGAKLALGSRALGRELGAESEEALLQVKGQELPAHDPRFKTGVGLQYAISAHGADHWAAQHDVLYREKDSGPMRSIAPLGITEPVSITDLSAEKVRLFYYTHLLTMMYDCLGICVFGYISRSMIPLDKLVGLVEAVTGWKTSLWELMKAGERVSVMMRAFNAREGLNKKDDLLPARLYQKVASGPLKGSPGIDPGEFNRALDIFYQMAGYDEKGVPGTGKLSELGLEWIRTEQVSHDNK